MITGIWLVDFLIGVLAWIVTTTILASLTGRWLRGRSGDDKGA